MCTSTFSRLNTGPGNRQCTLVSSLQALPSELDLRNNLYVLILKFGIWGALCSQHFEYGSNYGHVLPVSRPLARMRFCVTPTDSHARYTLGGIKVARGGVNG